MGKGPSTFSCIDHSSTRAEMKMDLDLAPLLLALKEIAEALKSQKLSVELPEPTVIELAPVVHVEAPILNIPQAQAPAITVQPCIPEINVHPSETVIMNNDGTKVTPRIDVILPMKPIWIGVSIPSVLVLIDIILRVIR